MCILVSGLFLSLNDMIFKSLVPHYPAGQILFTNGALVSLMIWFYLRFWTGQGVRVVNRRGHLARGLLFVLASFSFVISLKHLTLAQTICIAFAGPLMVTVMARQFLGEQVGFIRLLAVVVGFIGVIIIIQPGTSSFRWVLLLPLLVAFGDAARDVITRGIAAGESSLSIVFTTSLILALAASLTFPLGWNAINIEHLWRWGATTILTVAAYYFMVEAYRHAPAVVVAPFRYIQIVWGVLAGIIIWGEIPGFHIYIGAGLTVGAGIFIAYRETRLAQSIART